MTDVDATVNEVFRRDWARVVANLIRLTGDWDLAEEAAQDAFVRALDRWRRDGVPENPAAWLMVTARNRALDIVRRRDLSVAKHEQLMQLRSGDAVEAADAAGVDDRLRLMFACCHPALSLEAQVALTLRTLAGLSTSEIACAFLVSEQTMAKRLVRAKSKIRDAGIPFRVPAQHVLADRTAALRGVLYLLFREGYRASSGPTLLRADLSEEAIRLGRLLCDLIPEDGEGIALLALMLLHDSRRAARIDALGTLVPLEEQNRQLWNHSQIEEATRLVDGLRNTRCTGAYQLQAEIALCHATSLEPRDTDWNRVSRLYEQLLVVHPTPVVALNHAVAVGMDHGPAQGLALVEALIEQGDLRGYSLLAATRADLLRRLGRRAEAGKAYIDAIAVASNEAERRYLRRRLVEVSPDSAAVVARAGVLDTGKDGSAPVSWN